MNLTKVKDELGSAFTVHLPFYSLELASFNEHIREASVETVVKAIELAAPLEPESYVLHTTGSLAAEFSRLTLSRDMVTLICSYMSIFAARSLEEILTRSEIDPRKIAIENVEFPFEITHELVEQYGTSICFDTGHLLTHYSGTESVLDFYRQHRDRIIEIHLHDGSYEKRDDVVVHRDHIPLGRGVMPVRDFLKELLKSKFNGPIIFELSNDEVKESLDYIRKVVPEALAQ
jgi:sugar phosphate isomerase/epimerase